MFNRTDVDVIKTLLIPPLEILANPEYQERIWVNNPNLSVSYWELIENFFEISRTFFSYDEEYQLDEKNRESLKELYEMVDKYYAYKMLNSNDDVQSFINHPDWVKIQWKAKELVEALRILVAARHRDVVETELVPSIEELANHTYQEKKWMFPEGKFTYSNWFMNFCEICDFLLLPSEEGLNQKNKQQLNDLYKKVDEFDDTWRKNLERDASSLISHPNWIEIQNHAAEFLKILKNR